MALNEGFILLISRLSLRISSKLEEQELRTEKSVKETGWPVCLWCVKAADKVVKEIGFLV